MSEQPRWEEKMRIEDESVVTVLREKGITNAESLELLNKWVEQNEAEANKENTSKANIECAVKTAKLVYQAGFVTEALEALEDPRQAAHNEGEEDLFNQIEILMDRMEAGEHL